MEQLRAMLTDRKISPEQYKNALLARRFRGITTLRKNMRGVIKNEIKNPR